MELLSIMWDVADDEMVKIDLKVKQINRTSFALSGTVDLRYEFSENTMINAYAQYYWIYYLQINVITYHSPSGNSDNYRELPYHLSAKVFDCLDKYYNETFKNFLSCLNLPQIETEARDYKYRQLYIIDRCTLSNDAAPNYLPDGYYKVLAQFTGETKWSLTGLLYVESILKK
uniref:Uncharacterized protein n=1 Tax=Glossina palpalis gambiensis TaxID=67801 RepID=A0A1B0B4Q9_9MUSC